ncbi:MAG: TIGR03067 domain-containing protein [Planctomycetes bacterium]|nr:TIGR03067 domain-containing protein [Planctomycetota bacterium]
MKIAALFLLTVCAVLAGSVRGADEKDAALKAVQGTWLPVAGELAGQKMPEDGLKGIKLVLDGDTYTLTNAIGDDKGVIKVDASKKPMAMDIIGKEGPNKGKEYPAIYELKDDTMTICYDLSGQARPTEFKTKPGTKLFLMTYKLEKKR